MFSKVTFSATESANDQLQPVIDALLEGAKQIAFWVRQGALGAALGSSAQQNIQGETQKTLDILANQLFKDLLAQCPSVAALASEEEDSLVALNRNGQYLVAFDPLDGSANIDHNGLIGSIFSIYIRRSDLALDDEAQFLQPGHQQLCAGYVLYGPSTILMITQSAGVNAYTLDPTSNQFKLIQEGVKIPLDTQDFATNMSKSWAWRQELRSYLDDLLLGESGPRAKRFNMRWNAAMVGDVHRIMGAGGIFLYPLDRRGEIPTAKLRLLYEVNPMALLVERAGGKAWSETQRILDIVPEQLHQRVEVMLGSANELDTCMSYLGLPV